MVKPMEKVVQEFHDKLGISGREALKPLDDKLTMKNYGLQIASISRYFLEIHKNWSKTRKGGFKSDTPYLRMHLILEEAAELMQAFVETDEEAVFDALSDLIYVTAGTAAVYDLPLQEGFAEVHRSNMTKEKQKSDPDAERVRDKGPNYDPPNLKSLLDDRRTPPALEVPEVE